MRTADLLTRFDTDSIPVQKYSWSANIRHGESDPDLDSEFKSGFPKFSEDFLVPWAPAGFFPGVGRLGIWGRK